MVQRENKFIEAHKICSTYFTWPMEDRLDAGSANDTGTGLRYRYNIPCVEDLREWRRKFSSVAAAGAPTTRQVTQRKREESMGLGLVGNISS
jgi:hypothetical protein